MRDADHRAFQHAGQIVQHQLHLLRIDVEPAGDHQILCAPDDGHIAVAVHEPQIAGDEEAVGTKLLRRLRGHLPIALEHVRPAHLQRPDLPPGQFGP